MAVKFMFTVRDDVSLGQQYNNTFMKTEKSHETLENIIKKL